ncbi:UDP-glucose 6-dehydrogenase [Candidatus Magnetomorum sp. HK-1]|nr:UDP-glucose 6-dehydrogenase [Candidatus Magnetomorum sp. HK-1]
MNYTINILCIGGGYVGGPTMSMIALKCHYCKVTIVDINKDRIDQWNSNSLPIYEPGLHEIVISRRGKKLFFLTDIENGIKEADIIFVAVNTPTKEFGVGAGMATDLQYWEKTARQILEYSESSKIVVDKSTLPVKTAQAMERILSVNNNEVRFEVLSNPEFLAEGTAVKDLLTPDRVLIGSQETKEGLKARKVLVDIYSNWVPEDKILTSNIWSSELSKLVANAFLAQRVSSINSISALCEITNSDIDEVAMAVGMDNRIGSKFLKASIGFGGSCFKKDILNLVYICKSYGLSEVAEYWENVVNINIYQQEQERFVIEIIKSMFNTLAGRKIVLFGSAFKANTDDTRESPALFIARRLLQEKANLVISDPRALKNSKKSLENIKGSVAYIEDPYEATIACHAIIVCTEWEIYSKLDYNRIYNNMVKPTFFFDGRNIVDRKNLYKIGFNVFSIGKPALTHF